jgi:hypothetical protein
VETFHVSDARPQRPRVIACGGEAMGETSCRSLSTGSDFPELQSAQPR